MAFSLFTHQACLTMCSCTGINGNKSFIAIFDCYVYADPNFYPKRFIAILYYCIFKPACFISESTFLVFAKQSKIGCSIVSTVSKRKMHCLLRRHKPNVISDLDVMYIAGLYTRAYRTPGCRVSPPTVVSALRTLVFTGFLKSFRQIIFFQARAPVRIAKCRLDVGHRLLVRIVRFIFFVCK